MKTRLERTADGTAWNLYVNDCPAVTYESYAVCCAVESALQRPLTGRFYSEAAEIADVIRGVLRDKQAS